MKNKIIIGILSLSVLAGLVWMLSGDSSKENINNKLAESLNAEDGVICEQVVAVGDDHKLKTTIYFYKDMLRYDSVMDKKVQGQKDMHSISKDGYSYIWGDGTIGSMLGGSSGGMKIKNDDENAPKPDIDFEEIKARGFSAPGLNCKAWKADMSVFELPKDMSFKSMDEMMDFSKMMGDSMTNPNTGEITSNGLCQMCENIPDTDAKKECLESCQQEAE